MAEAIGDILVSMLHSEEILKGAARAIAERIEAEAAAADRMAGELETAKAVARAWAPLPV